MPEDDGTLGGNIVDAVRHGVGGRGRVGVDAPFFGEPTAVDEVGGEEGGEGDNENGKPVHGENPCIDSAIEWRPVRRQILLYES